MKNSVMIIFVISFICIINNINNIFAMELPANIKIGLYFDKTAATSVEVESKTGLQVGFDKDGTLHFLVSMPEVKRFVVRKDSYYADTVGGVVEYNPEAALIPEGTKFGPFHIQIGESFDNYEAVMLKMNTYSQANLITYPAFLNGRFYILAGFFTSLNDANSALPYFQNAAGGAICTVITPSSTRIQVLVNGAEVGLMFDDSYSYLNIIPIPANDAVPIISINKKDYRGSAEFKRINGSDMTVINRVDLEQYLYAVLPKEMGGNWPLEALKAQAVAARTYTILSLDKYKKFGFNLCDTALSQVYGGYRSENPNCTRAVDETRGKILTYEGKPANTYYFSSSGGHTEDVKNVWGSSIPYLTGVEDPYEQTERSDKGKWTVEMTPAMVAETLKSKGYDVGAVLSIKATEYSKSGRVIKLKIVGTKDTVELIREEPRKIFGYNVLNSQMFTVREDNSFFLISQNGSMPVPASGSQIKLLSAEGISSVNVSAGKVFLKGADSEKSYPVIAEKYVFEGRGWGHGVGLSQWGARGMAEAGFTYDQILTHYFTGTKVE